MAVGAIVEAEVHQLATFVLIFSELGAAGLVVAAAFFTAWLVLVRGASGAVLNQPTTQTEMSALTL
jgi:hypothetical protein